MHKTQLIFFQLYSVESSTEKSNLKQIGTVSKHACDIIKSQNETVIAFTNESNEFIGNLIITKEKLSKSQPHNIISMQFHGKFDVKKCIFFKFLTKKPKENNYLPVYQSEAKLTDITRNINWKVIKLKESQLPQDNESKNILIEVHDLTKLKANLLLSEEFFYKDLVDRKANLKIPNVGALYIDNFEYEKRFTFQDYLRAGLQVSMILALDFSGSNGPPEKMDSLHYFDKNNKLNNQYLRAISEVGNVLAKLDDNNMIPVFGFSARLPRMGNESSNYFALNGNIFDPEIEGIEGVLKLYQENSKHLIFSEPTYLTPIINYVKKMAKGYIEDGSNDHYFVLMILTDGQIFDLDTVINEIIEAALLPISIIIVGLGEKYNFKDMIFLDTKKDMMRDAKGDYAIRDIVHFVELGKLKSAEHILTSNTLEELPKQVCDYMQHMKLKPEMITPKKKSNFNFFKMTQLNILEKSKENPNQNNFIKAIKHGVPSLEKKFYSFFENSNYENILTKYKRRNASKII